MARRRGSELNRLENLLNEQKEVFNSTLNQFEGRQALTRLINRTFDGNRDLYNVLGYPTRIDINALFELYNRQDIAKRIVSAFPEATWGESPRIVEDDDTDNDTAFELGYEQLSKRLRLYYYLLRLDKLQNLGQYAVLLIGANDVSDVSELTMPLERVSGPDDIIYVTPYSQKNAEILRYETNQTSPRYGKPLIYGITPEGNITGARVDTQRTFQVHHSRIIHVAEDLLDNDILGTPRLYPVFNRLLDLEKVVGGSAEIFWLNARGGLHFDIDKETDLNATQAAQLKDYFANYQHKLTRFIQTQGVNVNALNHPIGDPSNHVSVIIDLISAATGIPKRILTGSERGELASSQDEKNWNSRIEERRKNFINPIILEAIIDKFIEIGALPSPTEYKIIWKEKESISEKERSEIALNQARALQAYTSAAGTPPEFIVPPHQFTQDLLGIDYLEDDIKQSMQDVAFVNDPLPDA